MLHRYPVLAGRLKSDHRGACRIEILPAPHAGTQFFFADLSGDHDFPSFEELQKSNFPYADGDSDGLRALRPDPFALERDGHSPFISQLSRVQGGHILTFAFSHQVADIVMYRGIVETWARETLEVSKAKVQGRPISPMPPSLWRELSDRARFPAQKAKPRDTDGAVNTSRVLPLWILVDPTIPSTLEDMGSIIPPAYLPPAPSQVEINQRVPITGIWRFSRAIVKDLQQSISSISQGQIRLSSMDILTALLWERFITAKYMLSRSDATSRAPPKSSSIVFALDIRRRVDPPLPDQYLPACVDLARCSAPLTTEDNRLNTIASMAEKIRKANETWNEEDHKSMLALTRSAPVSPGVVPRGPIDLLVTDHSRIPEVVSSDWGPGLGVPVAVREPYLGRSIPTGEITILSRRPNGDLEVMVCGERIVLERLERDAEFARRARLLFLQHDVPAECRKRRMRQRL